MQIELTQKRKQHEIARARMRCACGPFSSLFFNPKCVAYVSEHLLPMSPTIHSSPHSKLCLITG